MGDIFRLVSTSTGDHSDSDIFVCGNLTDKTDILANRIAASIAREVAKPEFQGSSEGETLPVSTSTEAVRIVEKFPADFGTIEKVPKPPINPPILVVPATFVEEILSRFLAKVLRSTDGTSPNSRRHLSRSKVNEIVEDLKEAMEQGLSKHKIEMVTVIIEELSDCPFLQAGGDNPATPSQSAMNPGRIADMVLSQVSVSEELETWSSEETIPVSTTNITTSKTEELPVKTIPYIRITHTPIAPDLVSDHLRVISLKTEPPEKVQKASIAQTEKCSENESLTSEAQRNEDSHFSLGSTGQPVVRPEEIRLSVAQGMQVKDRY
ncbi:fibrous sheath-interacting protein 2-like [Alligator sinensis]|uniref:Fibrous sheath-interacting protein 2-like n=1 Tax=Alligator sinensis TaxID=38654 RepID=A0A3Q0FXD6_ALLSI|nr:fibrous sheath-interacting protein 2-like [Alligator sinensis]